jgi:large subunit ribosomal protein L22
VTRKRQIRYEERAVISNAKVRFLKTSAQKTRLVVNQIRGRTVGEAMAILRGSPKMVARDVEKLLKSAVANAQQGETRVDVDRLYVSRAVVDQGPTEKRARARSMGRIYRILKRRCHVAVELDARK